jgi:hypothetical protein
MLESAKLLALRIPSLSQGERTHRSEQNNSDPDLTESQMS